MKNRLQFHLGNVPYFILLLPAFLVLHIELEFPSLIDYKFVYVEIIKLVVVAPILFLLLMLWLKDRYRAAVIAFSISVVYYYFCDLKDGLHERYPDLFFSSYIFLIPTLALLLSSIVYKTFSNRSNLAGSFQFLNILMIAFISWDLSMLLFNKKITSSDMGDPKKTFVRQYKPCTNCVHPDIYYIVFDEYSSSRILKQEFNFDNSSIDTFLLQKGFYIPANSKSNYNLTPFSIGSTFNLNYLKNTYPGKVQLLKDYLPAVSTVFHSELVPVLVKEGYRIFNHSVFNLKDFPATSDAFDPWYQSDIYLRHNIINKIDEDLGYLIRPLLGLRTVNTNVENYAEKRNEFVVKTINDFSRTIQVDTVGSKFVYAHFLIPHSPFAIDSLGKFYTPDTKKAIRLDYDGYTQQVIYTNSLIRRFVHEIEASSSKPFIIILQSDHGFRFNETEKLKYQFPNHSAYYFFNHDYRQLSDSMRNVNTFRVVLNTFFQQNIPLLKDSTIDLRW